MKYYLSLDKGQAFKNKDRFIKINLKEINEKLVQNNNLQALVTFTCSFASSSQLKEFLTKKGLIEPRNVNCNLVITYEREYIRFRAVPYKDDTKYLDYRNLEEIICQFCKKPGFLQTIIQNYNYFPNLSQEIYSFRSYLSNPYAEYKFYDVARSFVGKICFREKNGKRLINFKGLFDLGMLLAKLTKPKTKSKQIITKSKEAEQQYSEDDPKYYQLEELNSRLEREEDDQMRLF